MSHVGAALTFCVCVPQIHAQFHPQALLLMALKDRDFIQLWCLVVGPGEVTGLGWCLMSGSWWLCKEGERESPTRIGIIHTWAVT